MAAPRSAGPRAGPWSSSSSLTRRSVALLALLPWHVSERRADASHTCARRQVVPSPSTPSGWVLRQIVHDTITIFEINRKECARLLLELPNWLESGTFKPPAHVVVEADGPQPTWSLESLVVSTILSTIIRLPSPAHTTLYYTSLLVELCKFSPATVAPPVGKTARKLYAALDDGLDVECARRIADWLSVHLSNFGFQWLWRDWCVCLPASTRPLPLG